jgi:hypothetical protein
LVTEVVPESNERNAAGNGGVFSLLAGLAIGCALTGLLELTRTFGAFGNLQFIPTEATEASFVSWTWAMLSAPVAVFASALIVALSLARFRSILITAAASLIATLWLAARVLENVNGYLTPEQGVEASMPPLAADRWPFVYRHGIAVLLCFVVIALAAIAYALWRTRPRAIAFTFGLLGALLIVYVGGQFGFTAMAFFRLRNLAVAAAGIDLVLVALAVRRRRDVIILLAFLLLAASAWRLDRSWRAMVAELPHGIEMPAW